MGEVGEKGKCWETLRTRMLAFLGPVSQLYHLEEGTKEEIVGCGYVGMSGFMSTVERPCWMSTLYLPGVCEPLCCWGVLCILCMAGWRSRILVHMVKKKQEDNVSGVAGFGGQRVATSVFKSSHNAFMR